MTTTTPSSAALTPTFALNKGDSYNDFVTAQFIAVALNEGHKRIRGLGWATDFTDVDALGEVIASASFHHNGAREVLIRVGDGIAWAVIYSRRLVARLAASSEATLDQIETAFRARLPELAPEPERQEVAFRFWASSPGGDFGFRVNKLAVPAWDDVQSNYADATRAALDRTMIGFQPGEGGRLMLWTGDPGTGKTYAIRALAWAWREWCDVHYVVDPEVLFGSATQYLIDLFSPDSNTQNPPERDRWRLVVLEDTGELLTADARSRAGQGLSRLLNVVDGLLGQGSRTLVLVTTNEPMTSLHPAVARPGRCASHINFDALSGATLSEWRAAHDLAPTPSRHNTLAELYAETRGVDNVAPIRRPIGFAA